MALIYIIFISLRNKRLSKIRGIKWRVRMGNRKRIGQKARWQRIEALSLVYCRMVESLHEGEGRKWTTISQEGEEQGEKARGCRLGG